MFGFQKHGSVTVMAIIFLLIAAAHAQSIQPKPLAGKRLAPASAQTMPPGKNDVDSYNTAGAPKPVKSPRQNYVSPNGMRASGGAWPPPESLPQVKYQDDVHETRATDPSTIGGCIDMNGNTPRFMYGQVIVFMQTCHRDGNQVWFSGLVQYYGNERNLVVLHRFTITDNTGREYHVEKGTFGRSHGFGAGYSYQWMGPGTPVISFSFVASSLDTDYPTPESLSLTMPFNQSTERQEAIIFSNIKGR